MKPLVYIQCISGFLQDETQDHGIARLHWELGQYRDNNKVMVSYSPWNADWKSKAKYLSLLRNKVQGNIWIVVIGYSWGAGFGAKKLSQYLHKENIAVERMVLSDPVYRSRLMSFRWLAICPSWLYQPKITYPPNVRELRYFTQTYGQPTGDKCVIDKGLGKVIGPTETDNVPHVAMDDYTPFHLECNKVVDEVLQDVFPVN